MLKRIVLFILMVFSPILKEAAAEDFRMIAMSGQAVPGSKTFIVLLWSDVKDAQGFNLYRKESAGGIYPKSPVNSVPISMITDCGLIKDIITPGSDEWIQLSALIKAAASPVKTAKAIGTPLPVKKLYTPCDLPSVNQSSLAWRRIKVLAQRYYRISLVIGQAYMDKPLQAGSEYWYQINAVKAGGEEIVLASDVHVVAGVATLLPAPANLSVVAGDGRVMVTFDSVQSAIGYDVFRRRVPGLSAPRVNESVVTTLLTHDLKGDSILAPRYGLIDFQRWDAAGYPVDHEVDGTSVQGPVNGSSYQYQVAARNLLGTSGIKSAFSVSVKPEDKTPPGLPTDLKVEAVGQQLKVSWSQVTRDILNHIEVGGIKGYDIFRADSVYHIPATRLNSSPILTPALPSDHVQYVDADPAIISHYGEKEFYYRIKSYDNSGNAGYISAAVSGHVDDIYPPDPPSSVDAEGHHTFIRVLWHLNGEPDIESYLIYRSLCHYGEWLPPAQTKETGIDCGPFALLGEITHLAARDSAEKYGDACFNDLTVPAGSPICYAYWVKAKDKSQNQSGHWPYPNPITEKTVCQRLRDETPPPPPIVSALQARDDKIYIEWIAAPCQDLGAFHVYRADKVTGPFIWLGGVTVEEPPTAPLYLGAPFKPSKPCGCDSIPLEPHAGMKSGSFEDKTAIANTIYWYRVTSVDQNGNERDPEESVSYSTFTFKSAGPAAPVISAPIKKHTSGCGLDIAWTPAFNAATHLGFVVFRSGSISGLYRQISPVLTVNSYVDSTVQANAGYWYKVQAFDLVGRPSRMSTAVGGSY